MLKIVINPMNREEVEISIRMLQATLGEVPSKEVVKEAPKTTAKPKAAAKVETQAPTEEMKEEAQVPAPVEDAPGVTLTDLRALLAEKVDKNRETILAKIQEYKAKSLTTLDPVHYPAMSHFLRELK